MVCITICAGKRGCSLEKRVEIYPAMLVIKNKVLEP